MKPAELEAELGRRLRDHAALTTGRLKPAWCAWVEFVQDPVEGCSPERDEDLLLFEGSLVPGADRAGSAQVRLLFGRDLSPRGTRGERTGMRHADLVLTADVGLEVREFERVDVPGRGGTQASPWVRRVEATIAFQAAMASEQATVSYSAGDD
jgi:hypothetical protein